MGGKEEEKHLKGSKRSNQLVVSIQDARQRRQPEFSVLNDKSDTTGFDETVISIKTVNAASD